MSKAQDAGDGRLIKRYANRKLYDTQDSRYVTLQQIAHYVRDGEHVRIIDNKTKEDLTKLTLAQIIYEEEKKGGDTPNWSVSSLRTLIQESRERLITSLREGPMGKLVPNKREDGEGEEEETTEAPAAPETDESSSSSEKSWSPKEALDELQRVADERVRSLLGVAASHVNQLQAEVKRLQDHIEELESRLVNLSRRSEDPEEKSGKD